MERDLWKNATLKKSSGFRNLNARVNVQIFNVLIWIWKIKRAVRETNLHFLRNVQNSDRLGRLSLPPRNWVNDHTLANPSTSDNAWEKVLIKAPL